MLAWLVPVLITSAVVCLIAAVVPILVMMSSKKKVTEYQINPSAKATTTVVQEP